MVAMGTPEVSRLVFTVASDTTDMTLVAEGGKVLAGWSGLELPTP